MLISSSKALMRPCGCVSTSYGRLSLSAPRLTGIDALQRRASSNVSFAEAARYAMGDSQSLETAPTSIASQGEQSAEHSLSSDAPGSLAPYSERGVTLAGAQRQEPRKPRKPKSGILRIGGFVRTFKPGSHLRPWSLEPQNIHGNPRSYYLSRLRGPTRKQWRYSDPLLALGLDPRRETGNGGLLKDFLGLTGRIKPRAESGLSPKMQERVRRATLRSRAFGHSYYFSDRGTPTSAWDDQRADELLKGSTRSLPS